MTATSITLTATAQDFRGAAVGNAANPVTLRIALCGYGPQLPRIVGTAMLARVGPIDIQQSSNAFSVSLWGNDQITPAGTYYAIELIDAQGNVVQVGAYDITTTGGASQDLSNLTPIAGLGYTYPQGYIPIATFTGSPALSAAGWTGILTFDLTLTGNASPTLSGFAPGQMVQFIIRNPTGGFTFTWPANVINPQLVDTTAGSVTTAIYIADAAGNLRPTNAWNNS